MKLKTQSEEVVVYLDPGPSTLATRLLMCDWDGRPRRDVLRLNGGGGQGIDHGIDTILHDLAFRWRDNIGMLYECFD
jgi:hypothetical protein